MPNSSTPIHLCYFCSVSTFNSGMPISTFKLIKEFGSNKRYKTFCVFPSEGELPQRVRECGVNVTIIPFHRIRRGWAFALSVVTFFSAFFRFIIFLNKNHIKIVHFSDLIDFPYYPAARFAKARCVAHLRMNIERKLQRSFFSIWTNLFCHTLICISKSVKKHSGIHNKKAVVVYNPGPDPKLFNTSISYPTPSGFDLKKNNIVSIANFRSVKGLEHFIKVASIIESSIPDATHYIMAGEKLPAHLHYFNSLQDSIQTYGLSSKFSILEGIKHESIPSILQHAFVLMHLPNYQEGFGGVILEAMIMGTPVVAFDSGGVSECFSNGVSGYIVPQFDTSAAAQSVVNLLKDPSLRKQMSNGALGEIKSFSYTKHFDEIDKIYNGYV